MAGHKKKLKVSVEEDHDENSLSSFEELPDAIMEELKEHQLDSLESFEQYSEKIRAKLHHNADAFRHRLVKGYQALVDELTHEKK